MAEMLGWPVGHLKLMMSSEELSGWGAELELRRDEQEEAEMQARVDAEVKGQ